MKLIKFSIVAIIFTLMTQMNAFAQNALATITAESGSRVADQANCWSFGTFSPSNASIITGNYSYRGNQATNQSLGACWIQAPWCKFPSAGNITLKAKNDGGPATWRRLVFSYYLYDANAPFGQGALVRFDSVTYGTGVSPVTSATIPNTTQTITIAIPSAIISSNSVFKIMISAIGSGGTGRWILDDINIPATYWSNPSNSCLPQALIVDADSDGVQDSDDAFPNDPTRAYVTYYPASGFGTLMFEDLWPNTGDYDMNDLVVDYQTITTSNAANNVVDVTIKSLVRANGGSYRNGFAYQFDNIAPSKITSVTGTNLHSGTWADGLNASNGTENGQTYANVLVFDDAYLVLGSPGGSFINTILANPSASSQLITTVVTFNTTTGQSTPASSISLNPYMIINGVRANEVHLANRVPSAKANTAQFGTGQDDTNPSAGKYYKTKNNLPFALDVTNSMIYMQEKNDFTSGYLKFADWVQSSGSSSTDWYSNTSSGYRDNSKLYIK